MTKLFCTWDKMDGYNVNFSAMSDHGTPWKVKIPN